MRTWQPSSVGEAGGRQLDERCALEALTRPLLLTPKLDVTGGYPMTAFSSFGVASALSGLVLSKMCSSQ